MVEMNIQYTRRLDSTESFTPAQLSCCLANPINTTSFLPWCIAPSITLCLSNCKCSPRIKILSTKSPNKSTIWTSPHRLRSNHSFEKCPWTQHGFSLQSGCCYTLTPATVRGAERPQRRRAMKSNEWVFLLRHLTPTCHVPVLSHTHFSLSH